MGTFTHREWGNCSGLDDLKSDGLTDFGYANLKAIYDAGYGYIHLDMDAPVIEELPYEEW